MNDYEIAKLYKEFGTVNANTPRWYVSETGSLFPTSHYYVPCLPLPTEQECRELMESLLPDSWDYYLGVARLRIFDPSGKATGRDNGVFVFGGCPSEAYLLAAQWLKEQAEPKPEPVWRAMPSKFNVGDYVVSNEGSLGKVHAKCVCGYYVWWDGNDAPSVVATREQYLKPAPRPTIETGVFSVYADSPSTVKLTMSDGREVTVQIPPKEPTEPKFKVGDLVYHTYLVEFGIITGFYSDDEAKILAPESRQGWKLKSIVPLVKTIAELKKKA